MKKFSHLQIEDEDTVFSKRKGYRRLIKKKSGLSNTERRKKWNKFLKQNPKFKEMGDE
jgi:hypothetical protein